MACDMEDGATNSQSGRHFVLRSKNRADNMPVLVVFLGYFAPIAGVRLMA